jgi:hypothetical protein
MPCRRNPPYLFPSDPEYISESSSQSSPHQGSEASYDDYGQVRGGGTGQGIPLDENGRYIYSQVGMPVIASPSPPSLGPSTVPQAVEADTPYYFPHLHTNIS